MKIIESNIECDWIIVKIDLDFVLKHHFEKCKIL